jgi:hypothetical protein
MNIIIQRLKSKTFWAAMAGILLTIFEVNSGFFASMLPEAYRPALVMFWPVVMLFMREFTNSALADK